MRRAKVANKRNSHISVPLEWLDWSNWWTDYSFDNCYLHVRGNPAADPDGRYNLADRVFRVYARRRRDETQPPRLEMIKGELHWLIDIDTKGEMGMSAAFAQELATVAR